MIVLIIVIVGLFILNTLFHGMIELYLYRSIIKNNADLNKKIIGHAHKCCVMKIKKLQQNVKENENENENNQDLYV